VVVGNPARIRGYLDTGRAIEAAQAELTVSPGVHRSRVPGVSLHRLPLNRDLRGSLAVGEFPREIPFEPKRYFVVFDVSGSEIRGEHAHRSCHLFLVCVHGSISVVVDDGAQREEFRLDHPTLGLYLPPMVWATQYKHSADAVLLVFASDYYDPDDYIRDYQVFLDQVRGGRS
jgi:dTDP-4-dehydrorhamnose 3,5-epimerase-like enzyme